MARRNSGSNRAVETALRVFWQLPTPGKIVVAVLAAAVLGYLWWRSLPPRTPDVTVPPGTVVFMTWNVENLFDDVDDKRNRIDDPYDDWFAHDPAALRMKLDHLAEIILAVNGGNGPDILACVEVEDIRAATLLKDTLNAKLPAGSPPYNYLAMRELGRGAGRFIAPCVISKLPLDEANTRLLGENDRRILETAVVANDARLTVVVAHWTSKLPRSDGTDGEAQRVNYAETIYADYERAFRSDPAIDFLVCGDFNDTPNSVPILGALHMTADRAAVVPGATPPSLLGLLSNRPPADFGTLYHSGPLIYDHIGVSPGLLDGRGWACDPDSVRVPTAGMIRDSSRTRRPWRFGSKNDDPQGRGYADHFPVVVNLRLAGR